MEGVQSNRASVDEVKVHIHEKWPINIFIHWPKTILPLPILLHTVWSCWFVHQTKQQLQRASKGRDDMLWLIHRWPQHLHTSHERWEVISDTWCWLKKQGETRSWCGKQVTAVQVTLEVTSQLLKCITLQWLRPGWQIKPFECETFCQRRHNKDKNMSFHNVYDTEDAKINYA